MTAGPDGKQARWSPEIRAREHALLDDLAATPQEDPSRAGLRDELVTMNLPLVEHLARRFRDRGESHEDLVQVGTVGLINAVDRFDNSRGVEFSTYATPTIVGEIKRHFRDKGWAVRVPRRLQELRIAIARSSADLTQKSGRSPTVAELARDIKVSQEDVLEGLESAQAYATASLDAGSQDPSESATLGDTLGSDDDGLEGVDNRESLKPLLAALPERERRILFLRFFDNRTQSEIAEEIGVSQMHVSRILARTLEHLREELLDEY